MNQTTVDLPVIKSNLIHTLLKHPRFCSLQVEDEKEKGKLRWIPTNVDLEKHIIVPEIEPGMDSSDQFVEDYVSNLSKTTISKTQPLWDVHILNTKTSDAEAVGVFRIHHLLGDGNSLMSLLLACTRQISDPEALPMIPVKKSKDTKIQRLWQDFWAVAKCMVVVGTDAEHCGGHYHVWSNSAVLEGQRGSYFKGPPGVELMPRRFVYRTVSLEDRKMVKNPLNATVNDVALGVTQAGLLQYLNRRYAEIKKRHEATEIGDNLPKNICLRSTQLVNLRPSTGIQGLMVKFQSYVNKMTFVVSADEGTIPDPHQLCNDIVRALELAKDAVLESEQARGATSL